MKKRPSIAVLLAAYNGIFWIEKQIESLLYQKDVDIDIYVSIDLSNDGTLEKCEELASTYKNIIILPYGESFGSAGKNFFRLIRDVNLNIYDYIAFSDQDDIWLLNKLSCAVDYIIEKKLDGYSSNVIAFWENGNEVTINKALPQKKFDYFFESAGPGCTYVICKQPMEKFKKFLIRNWERINQVESHDWMIYAFCRNEGFKWGIDTRSLMKYRQHKNNSFGANFGINAFINRIKKIRNNWYRNEIKKIFSLLRINTKYNFTLNRLFLIKNFWHLRRKTSHAIFLLLMLVLNVF
ncbi:glycosyltransferase [Methylophilales bacterium]|nr:glycosyltransferase [Methylophilales bacterium]